MWPSPSASYFAIIFAASAADPEGKCAEGIGTAMLCIGCTPGRVIGCAPCMPGRAMLCTATAFQRTCGPPCYYKKWQGSEAGLDRTEALPPAGPALRGAVRAYELYEVCAELHDQRQRAR